MTPTTDRQVVLDRTRDGFGKEIDGVGLIEKWGGYVLEGAGGFMMFVLSGPQTYKVTVGFEPGSRGAPMLAAMNAGYQWIFENTDAETLIGYIDANDAASLAIVPHIHGASLIDRGETKIGVITRQSWDAERPKS